MTSNKNVRYLLFIISSLGPRKGDKPHRQYIFSRDFIIVFFNQHKFMSCSSTINGNNHPSAIIKLADKGRRDMVRRGSNYYCVEGSMFLPAVISVRYSNMDIFITQLLKIFFCL